jgi:hypothetical protein
MPGRKRTLISSNLGHRWVKGEQKPFGAWSGLRTQKSAKGRRCKSEFQQHAFAQEAASLAPIEILALWQRLAVPDNSADFSCGGSSSNRGDFALMRAGLLSSHGDLASTMPDRARRPAGFDLSDARSVSNRGGLVKKPCGGRLYRFPSRPARISIASVRGSIAYLDEFLSSLDRVLSCLNGLFVVSYRVLSLLTGFCLV